METLRDEILAELDTDPRVDAKVHSWHERSEASRAAWSIKGVTSVHNEVAIV